MSGKAGMACVFTNQEGLEVTHGSLAQDHVAVTGGENLSRKELAKLRKNAATPEFYDKNGNPLGEHLSLDEALQAGEDASRAAATASGTDNEYGVAAIKGNVNADGAQTY